MEEFEFTSSDDEYIIEEVTDDEAEELDAIIEEVIVEETPFDVFNESGTPNNKQSFLMTTGGEKVPASNGAVVTPAKSIEDDDGPSPMDITTTTVGTPSRSSMSGSTTLSSSRAAGAGLSELSKQLRIFQAKNESQAVELNRLERQLRILADLQGISVADMRRALEEACQNEAFGELQHRVASLRAQLEAASLMKKPSAASTQDEAKAHKIANLELRIGELEEIEEKQQATIQRLYEQLNAQTSRASRLGATGEHQEQEVKNLRKELAKEKTQRKKLLQRQAAEAGLKQMLAARGITTNENGVDATTGRGKNARGGKRGKSRATSDMATGEDGIDTDAYFSEVTLDEVAVQKIKDDLQAKHDEEMKRLSDEIKQVQIQRQVERDNLLLLKQQLEGAEEKHKLRSEQFKARFTVQQERIGDLEQQLTSLYTAFELLRDERAKEEESRKALRKSLNQADAEVARQVDAGEKHQRQSEARRSSSHGSNRLLASPRGSSGYADHTMSSSSTSTPPETIVISSPVASPRAQSSRALGLNRSEQFSSVPLSPTTFPDTSPSAHETVMQGVLLVRSKMMRNWKKKHAVLNAVFAQYRWDFVGDVDGKGKMYGIQVGVSKVQKYLKYPLAFAVYMNPYDATAPVVYAAATTVDDYHKWMAALTKACTGEESYENLVLNSPGPTPATPISMVTIETPRSVAEEQSDLERAIALSQHVV